MSSRSIHRATLPIAAALSGAFPVFADPLIELSDGTTTPFAGARVETFDNGKPKRYAGSGRILKGSFANSTSPENDNTVYYSVQPGAAAFVAEPGVSYNYFGLYWDVL